MAASVCGTDERVGFRYVDQAIQSERRDIAKILLLSIVTLMLFTIALWGFSPKEANTNDANTPIIRTDPDHEFTTTPPGSR